MFVEAISRGERLITLVALEWFYPQMALLVGLEVVGTQEGEGAEVTFESAFSFVGFLVG